MNIQGVPQPNSIVWPELWSWGLYKWNYNNGFLQCYNKRLSKTEKHWFLPDRLGMTRLGVWPNTRLWLKVYCNNEQLECYNIPKPQCYIYHQHVTSTFANVTDETGYNIQRSECYSSKLYKKDAQYTTIFIVLFNFIIIFSWVVIIFKVFVTILLLF